MYKLALKLLILVITLASCSRQTNSNKIQETGDNQNANLKLQILYFHNAHPCNTCYSIEANIKQVLEETFKAETDSGIISFEIVNIDEEANKKLAEEYQITGAALHLVKIANGKKIDKNFTEFAFANSRTQPEFFMQTLTDSIAFYIFNE